jgi:flagellum-specific peptidoglycan hydrolase FlgJ
VRAGDIEVGKDGSRRKIMQRFAAYRDIGESVEHYLRFINRERYRPALECIAAEDIGGFVTALKKGGYFTLALAEYLTGLSNVHDRVIKEMEDRG